MSDWIDLSALWRIVLAGVLFGAGLPALFGIGLRLLTPDPAGPQPVGSQRAITANPAAVAAAAVCFAVVLAAIGWGIYLIVSAT